MSGFAQGKKVIRALESVGIRPSAFIWRWRPGTQGGIFNKHLAINGQREHHKDDFDALPQHDVNGPYCECQLQTEFRDERGRFAPKPT